MFLTKFTSKQEPRTRSQRVIFNLIVGSWSIVAYAKKGSRGIFHADRIDIWSSKKLSSHASTTCIMIDSAVMLYFLCINFWTTWILAAYRIRYGRWIPITGLGMVCWTIFKSVGCSKAPIPNNIYLDVGKYLFFLFRLSLVGTLNFCENLHMMG